MCVLGIEYTQKKYFILKYKKMKMKITILVSQNNVHNGELYFSKILDNFIL